MGSIMAQLFDNVNIAFLSFDEKRYEYSASIAVRPSEMVIDIPEQGDGGPYLVHGQLFEHFYAGTDTMQHAEEADVVARWVKLGDVFVGIWFEEGLEYLFRFRLPLRRDDTAQARTSK